MGLHMAVDVQIQILSVLLKRAFCEGLRVEGAFPANAAFPQTIPAWPTQAELYRVA